MCQITSTAMTNIIQMPDFKCHFSVSEIYLRHSGLYPLCALSEGETQNFVQLCSNHQHEPIKCPVEQIRISDWFVTTVARKVALCMVVDVTTLKMARKPVKLKKENPAGCAGEGKQSKGNYENRKGRFKDNRKQLYVRKARLESVR